MKAIRIAAQGGLEALSFEDAPSPVPGADEIVVRNRAIGVNFIDVYHRNGLYKIPLPSGIGREGAGVVESVGANVMRFKPGDRVAYAGDRLGAYAELHAMPAKDAARVPNAISFEIAAAIMLKGLTAHYLLRKTFPVQRGEFALAHAAAGGVGQLLVQWGAHLGATIIAVVSSDAKAEIARALGAQHVIVTAREDIVTRVREITSGEGVHVSYDSVGKDTFDASLNSLRRRGMFVSFGNASGPAPAFNPQILAQKGSLFFTRPTLSDYIATEAMLDEAAHELFDVVASGAVKVQTPATYALADAASAHRDLESRATTGSLVLLP